MRFYPSKNHARLNGAPYHPEQVTGRAMLNPHHSTQVLPGTQVVWDSGAFQERATGRVTPAAALQRQLDAERATLGPEGHAEALVTYDRLVEEHGLLGEVLPATVQALQDTLAGAAYYASQRDRIRGAVAFAAQGATPRQYLACVGALLDLMQPGDWLAFGGFSLVGQRPALRPIFLETVARALPLLRCKGITRAHLLGVASWEVLAAAAAEGRKAGVEMSTDSSSLEVNSTMGRVWDEAYMATGSPWRARFAKGDKVTLDRQPGPGQYHPALLAVDNVGRFARWLGGLS